MDAFCKGETASFLQTMRQAIQVTELAWSHALESCNSIKQMNQFVSWCHLQDAVGLKLRYSIYIIKLKGLECSMKVSGSTDWLALTSYGKFLPLLSGKQLVATPNQIYWRSRYITSQPLNRQIWMAARPTAPLPEWISTDMPLRNLPLMIRE